MERGGTPTAPDSAAVQEALERVVASTAFAHSPRMSRFLRFVVEETSAGRAGELKEYVVGLRVFDKSRSYDPTVDPTVRVEAAKLRAKLARYYESEGRQETIVIEIPKGGYSARFNAGAEAVDDRRPSVEPAAASAPSAEGPSSPGAEPERRSIRPRERAAWALAGLFALVALIAAFVPRGRAVGVVPSAPVRFHLYPPNHVRVGDLRTYGPAVVSPDGRRLAFVGIDPDGQPRLWVHALDELTATAVAGTDGAAYPFWSADSASLAFFAAGKLKRVGLAASVAEELGVAPIGRGGAWSIGGPIAFVPAPGAAMTILAGDRRSPARFVHVPESPGLEQGLHPAFLPDGHRYLFIAAGSNARHAVPYLGDLRLDAGARPYAPIPETHSNVVYAASSDASALGYLLYVRGSSLIGMLVDAASLEPRGEPQLVADGVRSGVERWHGDFSASQNGVLVYRVTSPGSQRLAWYDRQGRLLDELSGPGSHRDVTLAPDRTQLAVLRFEAPVVSDIWIRDLARGVESQLTSAQGTHYTPVWSADGRDLYYVYRDVGGFGIHQHTFADGTRRQLVADRAEFLAVNAASTDGRRLLYQVRNAAGHFDLWMLELDDPPRAAPVLQTAADEVEAQFSPDGGWLVYVSNESARSEVYMSPLDNPKARLQVSANGGVQPRWRRDGREIFYVGLDGRLMSVAITAGSPPRLGTPVALFQTHINAITRDALQHFRFDVSFDGQRFITLASPEPEAAAPWTVVTNWTAGLR